MLVRDFSKSHQINSDFIINMSDIATEAGAVTGAGSMSDRSLNPSMKLGILTDDMIKKGNLKPVTNPIPFIRGTEPTPDGLFSYEIFGSTSETRRRQCAYIDLHEKFFHPFVYEILDRLIPKKFAKCAAGMGAWTIDGGVLKEVIDTDSPLYNVEHTGLRWLIKHYHDLDLQKNQSITRNDRITMLKNLKDNEIFITKWLVIPVFYRDVEITNGRRSVPELDDMYTNIIRYVNGLDDAFNFFSNSLVYNVQAALVQIRKHGQKLIELKHGFFHQNILGKNTDRGSRDVISVPPMNHYETPKQNPVDIFHTGIPVAKCLVLGYDFIMRYCLNFFANNFRNAASYPVYQLNNGSYEMIGSIPIKPQVEKFNTKYIEKKMEQYKQYHAGRFEPITITAADGREIPMHFSGLLQSMSGFNPDSVPNRLVNRPFTWTDLFYMAAVDTLSDKYVYITRYPVEDYSHIFPSKCTPVSTLRTIPVKVDGKLYPNYPVIDTTLPTDKIATLFIDTVTMSNLFLDALGGDYDGDTTIEKLCFTLEANEEAEKLSQDIRSFVSPDGKMLKFIKNEGYLAFYNMTRLD